MTANEIKIAAAYIRVSTEDQIEYSPDAQLFELRKFASKNGYLIPDEFIFQDEGISGKKANKRPEFLRMIAMAKTKDHPFESILVWKYSRFARNQEESIVYKSMLKRDNIDVVSITEPLLEGPFGSLIERIIEWMDEYYSIRLSGEVLKGMTEKARRGGLQSTASFGYKIENGALIIDLTEADYVREIFQRFLNGIGLYPIARWLNELGVRTHRGSMFENRTIEYILRNPVYIGKHRWNPTGRTRRDYTNENLIIADAAHEPIIDMDTWNKVQEHMVLMKTIWKYKGRPTYELKDWPSGIVRCASCNGTLIYALPHYYKCNNYARGACRTSQHIRADLLKEAIIEGLEHDALKTKKIEYSVVLSTGKGAEEAARLRNALDNLNKKSARLREAFLAGVDTVDEYKTYKADLDAEKEKLIASIHEIENPVSHDNMVDELKKAIAELVAVLRSPDASIQDKHDSAVEIIDTCVFDRTNNLLKIKYRVLF